MYMTAVFRLAVRQDILLAEAGNVKTVRRPPTAAEPLQQHLWSLENERRQPRVSQMRDELVEGANVLREALRFELLGRGVSMDSAREKVASVQIQDERKLFKGPDMIGIEELVQMAVACRDEDYLCTSNLETWLEEEEASVLSAFKLTGVTLSDAEGDSEAAENDEIAVPSEIAPSLEGYSCQSLERFLKTVGPEFDGKAEAILKATGLADLDDLIDLVDERSDLADLDNDDVGMKVLHVKKLFKAIMQEKRRRASMLDDV